MTEKYLIHLKAFLKKPAARGLLNIAIYALWGMGIRLIFLTFITYFLITPTTKFQEIGDTVAANEVTIMGIAAIGFILFSIWLNPITSTTVEELFTPYRFEKKFIPGFFFGSVLACGVALAFILSGQYRYFGALIQLEEAPLTMGSILLRVTALGAFAYCEEYLFRHKLLQNLRSSMSEPLAIVAAAVCFCLVKWIQFPLGWMHLITLLIISLLLGLRSLTQGDFLSGAGIWAGLLIVFQPLLSMPVFGSDFQGVLLVKFQALVDSQQELSRILTGGSGGPLSSFSLQLLLLVLLIQGIVKNKKILLNSKTAQKQRG